MTTTVSNPHTCEGREAEDLVRRGAAKASLPHPPKLFSSVFSTDSDQTTYSLYVAYTSVKVLIVQNVLR